MTSAKASQKTLYGRRSQCEKPERAPAELLAEVSSCAPISDRCTLWHGSKNKWGYGTTKYRGKPMNYHRAEWIRKVGEIPAGFDVHHLCGNRLCIKISHLQPMTHRENLLASDTIPGRNARKTHCPRGHQYKEPNIRFSKDGSRNCRACEKIRPRKPRRQRRYSLAPLGEKIKTQESGA